MKLFVHYLPENKTWSQGSIALIDTDGCSLNFDADRKYLIYGVAPSKASEIIETVKNSASQGKELTLYVNNAVGGYIWGIVKAEITGEGDGILCETYLPDDLATRIAARSDAILDMAKDEEALKRAEEVRLWLEEGISEE